MKFKNKILTIKKNDQMYLKELLNKYPNLKSGRKNYGFQYSRIIKNILMAKIYKSISKSNKKLLLDWSFKETNKIISIKYKQ